MYDRFLTRQREEYPALSSDTGLNLGLGIKQIRLRMGVTQEELAREAGMKPSALKTLENGYARFTKISNLEALAGALGASAREILLEGREWSSANFFVLKHGEQVLPKRRMRKPSGETWYRRAPLSFEGYTLNFCSPPLAAPSHFCFVLAEISPGREISGLRLRDPNQIAGLVLRGTLKITYDQKREMTLFGNQGFSLRGDKPHRFANPDRENPVRVCLAFSHEAGRRMKEEPKSKPGGPSLSVGKALHRIRRLYSDAANRLLTFSELSYLTGLDGKSLRYLENTTAGSQVVYWDKIEKIAQALKLPFSRFLDLAEGKDEGWIQTATAHDRAFIDYRHYLGVRIKSALFPGSANTLHLAEMSIEPRRGIRRVSWKRRDDARITAYVEEGELLVEVGQSRKAILKAGESVYFDGSLGYIFTNPGVKPARLLTASHPPIIF